MADYKVLRQHDGDKQYWEGDTRSLSKADAKPLVDLGILEAIEGAGDEKAAKPVANKAAPPLANKGGA